MTARQILTVHETPSHLYLLMRPYPRYGQEPADSSWWRKVWGRDEFVEVGERPVEKREAKVSWIAQRACDHPKSE